MGAQRSGNRSIVRIAAGYRVVCGEIEARARRNFRKDLASRKSRGGASYRRKRLADAGCSDSCALPERALVLLSGAHAGPVGPHRQSQGSGQAGGILSMKDPE